MNNLPSGKYDAAVLSITKIRKGLYKANFILVKSGERDTAFVFQRNVPQVIRHTSLEINYEKGGEWVICDRTKPIPVVELDIEFDTDYGSSSIIIARKTDDVASSDVGIKSIHQEFAEF